MPRENFKNEHRTVDDLRADVFFDIVQLTSREHIVENDEFRIFHLHEAFDFFKFTKPRTIALVGILFLDNRAFDVKSHRIGKSFQLLDFDVEVAARTDVYKDCPARFGRIVDNVGDHRFSFVFGDFRNHFGVVDFCRGLKIKPVDFFAVDKSDFDVVRPSVQHADGNHCVKAHRRERGRVHIRQFSASFRVSMHASHALKTLVAALQRKIFKRYRAAVSHSHRDDLSVSCDEHANLAVDFFGNFGNGRKNRPVDKKVFVVRSDKSFKPRKHGLFYSFRIAVNHNKIR